MDFLKKVYERRRKYFENLDYYLAEVRKPVDELCPDSEIYVFGSVVEGGSP